MLGAPADYFRRDQQKITAPNLAAMCTYAEHIVRARGKRTAYTSVSLSPDAIGDFGNTLYKVRRPKLDSDGHTLVENGRLLSELRAVAAKESKAERLRALQALRYAKRRSEGLIDWKFDISAVKPTDLISWAQSRVAAYFVKKG